MHAGLSSQCGQLPDSSSYLDHDVSSIVLHDVHVDLSSECGPLPDSISRMDLGLSSGAIPFCFMHSPLCQLCLVAQQSVIASSHRSFATNDARSTLFKRFLRESAIMSNDDPVGQSLLITCRVHIEGVQVSSASVSTTWTRSNSERLVILGNMCKDVGSPADLGLPIARQSNHALEGTMARRTLDKFYTSVFKDDLERAQVRDRTPPPVV